MWDAWIIWIYLMKMKILMIFLEFRPLILATQFSLIFPHTQLIPQILHGGFLPLNCVQSHQDLIDNSSQLFQIFPSIALKFFTGILIGSLRHFLWSLFFPLVRRVGENLSVCWPKRARAVRSIGQYWRHWIFHSTVNALKQSLELHWGLRLGFSMKHIFLWSFWVGLKNSQRFAMLPMLHSQFSSWGIPNV